MFEQAFRNIDDVLRKLTAFDELKRSLLRQAFSGAL